MNVANYAQFIYILIWSLTVTQNIFSVIIISSL